MINNGATISNAAITLPKTIHRVLFSKFFQSLNYVTIVFNGLILQAAPAQV